MLARYASPLPTASSLRRVCNGVYLALALFRYILIHIEIAISCQLVAASIHYCKISLAQMGRRLVYPTNSNVWIHQAGYGHNWAHSCFKITEISGGCVLLGYHRATPFFLTSSTLKLISESKHTRNKVEKWKESKHLRLKFCFYWKVEVHNNWTEGISCFVESDLLLPVEIQSTTVCIVHPQHPTFFNFLWSWMERERYWVIVNSRLH